MAGDDLSEKVFAFLRDALLDGFRLSWTSATAGAPAAGLACATRAWPQLR
jgi:hypothetical protein